MNVNLVYVHIGNVLPDGFIDNIYQTLLTNSHITIYILIDDLLIHNVKNKINLRNRLLKMLRANPTSTLKARISNLNKEIKKYFYLEKSKHVKRGIIRGNSKSL